jgi:hypothetical protein
MVGVKGVTTNELVSDCAGISISAGLTCEPGSMLLKGFEVHSAGVLGVTGSVLISLKGAGVLSVNGSSV